MKLWDISGDGKLLEGSVGCQGSWEVVLILLGGLGLVLFLNGFSGQAGLG